MKQKNYLIALICFFLTTNFYAANIYVSAAGNDDTGNGEIGSPYLTISHAVTQASSSDTIFVVGTVSFGTVGTPESEINLNLTGDNLTFQGQSNGIINRVLAAGTGRLFNVANDGVNATRTISFSDITFQNFDSTAQGAVLNHSSDPDAITFNFTNCNFLNNATSNENGGGVFYFGQEPTVNITGCTFYNNVVTSEGTNARGGAINFFANSTATIANSTFYQNKIAKAGNFHGAAIRVNSPDCVISVSNSLFYDNKSGNNLNSDFNGVGGADMNFTNSLAQYTNNIDTNTGSNLTADFTNTTFTFTSPNLTYTAPTSISDDTPIDFGSDASDVGAWDSNINLFVGSKDSDWDDTVNWSSTAIPLATDNVTLLSDSPALVVSATTDAVANDVAVNASSSLTINSGGSLIVNGSSSGDVTYNRNLGTENWYLVSSPVVGQDIDAFATAEGFASGTNDNRGFAPYNNADGSWTYYQAGASGTGNFLDAQGYSVKLASSGDIAFTGTMRTSNATVSITSGAGNTFNLVGNPYPSYIAANDDGANGLNNILTVNDTDNDFLAESTLWFWNQGTSSYDQINHASAAFYIAPGQGFFVDANATGAPHNLSITEAMQSHQGTDTFFRTENTRPEINITLSNGTDVRDADILYIDGTTTGFDNGYDSSIFGGISNPFAIYTHAVANGNGRNLGIQSLPDNDFENMIIPLGMNTISGSEIVLNASAVNIPVGINIYLEDKDNNSFTLLDGSSNYSTTLASDLNGIGRFYIHTTSSVLSTTKVLLENINIYATKSKTLRMIGLPTGSSSVKLFNILGKLVMQSRFISTGMKEISLPKLTTGVYFVQIDTEAGKLNKKIVVE